jgi:hypothetical protein
MSSAASSLARASAMKALDSSIAVIRESGSKRRASVRVTSPVAQPISSTRAPGAIESVLRRARSRAPKRAP